MDEKPMVEVLYQTFSPIIGHNIKIENFFCEVGEIFILLINWLKKIKN